MRALVQRVARGAVWVEGEKIAGIGRGLVVLLGVKKGDTPNDARYLAEKVAHLRIFEDERGKLNLSVKDIGGEVLVVSQFTLYGDCRRGRRPSFSEAAPAEEAEPLYRAFLAALREQGVPVAEGRFQAHMLVEIYNDGPVTLLLEGEGK
ncbi:D-tyrosyl-tRNA(Tyr) deacylase [Ammonifex degensii KC4]|uniref:D-aminoacyl-tRNA deacylase n=1 Tax=Ammonifex degensii (strain DSM 10501 / KC4) TaxID=429009 RepID=C9RBA7_AMMDK|nr:D-aminoacyl-tRNA deacylase [Ammonifex degensii]ACX51534.1 D-tyrosyl-tRNA(Tyr) deacylase [Ammonifex degensii KC4]